MAIQAFGAFYQTIHADNLSDLVGYKFSQPGNTAYVNSLACEFVAVPAHTSSSDGYVVLDGYNIQWQRVLGSSASKWLSQNTWYIDGVVGNDENDGYTSITPLKTTDEIQRRWGTNPIISQSTTIYIQSDLDHFILNATAGNETIILNIIGKTTPILTSTISSFIPWSHGTYGSVDPYPTKIQVTGVSNWTPYAGKMLLTVDGYSAWIDTPTLDGYAPFGINTASTSPFYNNGQNNPNNGTSISIVTLPIIKNFILDFKYNKDFAININIKNISFSKSFNSNSYCFISNCEFNNCSLINNEIITLLCCRFCPSIYSYYSISLNYSLSYNYTIYVNNGNAGYNGNSSINYTLSRTTTANTYCFGHFGVGYTGSLTNCQAFQSNPSYDLIHFGDNGGSTNNTKLLALNGFSGISVGNTCIALAQGTRLSISQSSGFNIVSKNKTNAGEFLLNGVYTGAKNSADFDWSDIVGKYIGIYGFVPGTWRGVATLISGSVTINLTPKMTSLFPSDVIPKYWIKSLGGVPGILSITSQTTSSFTITSTSNTDTSTIAYEVISNYVPDEVIYIR